ncbi:M20 metallopeptidase family protein [Confluentibacter citreus]|uniref:M20 metallopeptidase family protein n=1 Tax=Confluentibacter citreus TaxID=2007307 RepID=UPI000C28CF34|nr:M20 family metallopeptidase [Confluentibacter citreus]
MKTKILSLTFGLICGMSVFGQELKTENTIHDLIQQHTNTIYDNLIKMRRDFHRFPELSGEEKRTSEKIAEYLRSLGLEVRANIGGHGVVGILNGGKPGKRIAWRSDIDALETDFPDSVDFKSQTPGVRHICGHDIHTTIGLGIANVLSHHKDKLEGVVYFIFQPAEESFEGAKSMIDDGLFDIISPDEIYGLHIAPMPSGSVVVNPELVYAYKSIIEISLKNTSDLDSIVHYTKNLVSGFQNVQPDSKFWDSRNLVDTHVGIYNPNTIYKDYLTVNNNFNVEQSENQVKLSTVIMSSDKKHLDSIPQLIKEAISNSRYSDKLISVNYSKEFPSVINDPNLTNETIQIITKLYGEQSIIPIHGVIPNSNDDFAYFQHQVPGVYYFLGGSNYEANMISMPHTPDFVVDETCIKTGVTYFSSMIVERLDKQ